MAFRISKLALAMVIVTALPHEALRAQFFQGIRENPVPGAAGQQAVSATGTATVKRKPAVLRMYLELVSKGSNLDEALKNMKVQARKRSQSIGNSEGRQGCDRLRRSQPVRRGIAAAKADRGHAHGKNAEPRQKARQDPQSPHLLP